MVQPQGERQPDSFQVAAVILFYIGAALVMVFVNKAVLNATPTLPMSFLFIQLVLAVLLLHLVSFVSSTARLQRILPFKIRLPVLDGQTAIKLLPFVTVGVAGLSFNTLCLATVDASFFQIARGLLLPMTVVLSSVATRTLPKTAVVSSVLVVTLGFFLGLHPSSYITSSVIKNPPLLPILYGVLSSVMLALHAVLTKSAHAHVGNDNSVIKLMYYGNLMSAVFIVPFIFWNGEAGPLMTLWKVGGHDWRVFAIGTCVTGFFGFLLGVANLLSIKVTSPVTHMFSSAAKSVLQSILGSYLFGDIITSHRAASIVVITFGTLLYTWNQSNHQRSRSKDETKPHTAPSTDLEGGKATDGL